MKQISNLRIPVSSRLSLSVNCLQFNATEDNPASFVNQRSRIILTALALDYTCLDCYILRDSSLNLS